MIDPEKAFRRAVYQALIGTPITVTIDGSGSAVTIIDGPNDEAIGNFYIVLGSQTGNDISPKQKFFTTVSIVIDIVGRADHEMNKDYLDDIAEQVEAILLPSSPGVNSLVAQSGVSFGRLKRASARYMDLAINPTQTIMRKLLTFECAVYEN